MDVGLSDSWSGGEAIGAWMGVSFECDRQESSFDD
jgi:hypothetical protein